MTGPGEGQKEENMKSIRFSLSLLLLLAVLLVVGGCSKHYVDVYINERCALVAIDNDTAIDPLVVFPGDYVIFNNLRDEPVELNLPIGMFEEDNVTISAGKRVILKVIETGHREESMNIVCDDGSGTPKVVVGDDP